MTEVVIVGAGPVGLWVAIQLMRRDPSLKISMYERHEQYKRSHILQLEAASLLFYAKNGNGGQPEKDFFNEVMGTSSLAGLVKRSATVKSVFIRTNELEASLRKYAQSLGVTIHNKKIESPGEVEWRHLMCSTFIAADGARSGMRTALMGENAVKNKALQYVVEVKLELPGQHKPLSIPTVHALNLKTNSTVFEFVGKVGETTPVTLRLFMDEALYERVPEASFKNPIMLPSKEADALPLPIWKDISKYMELRGGKAKSGKLTKLTLSLYKAQQFAIKKDERAWFLAGDAAMGVPYFRSLNAGMIIGSQLAFILSGRNGNATKVGLYNACAPVDSAWEFTGAMGKDLAIRAYDSFRKFFKKE